MKILFYDKFCDLPERGIIELDGGNLAFVAQVIEDESMDLGELPGVCCKIVGYECDEKLLALFEEKDRIFDAWRRQFDAGLVGTATHPMYDDVRYQQISATIDKMFVSLPSPVFVKL